MSTKKTARKTQEEILQDVLEKQKQTEKAEVAAGQAAVQEGMAAEFDPQSKLPDSTLESMASKVEAIDVVQQSIDQQVNTLVRKTAEVLNAGPKEKVMIQGDPLNEADQYVVAGLNGYNLQIQRKVPVILPVPIIDLLVNGGYPVTLVR